MDPHRVRKWERANRTGMHLKDEKKPAMEMEKDREEQNISQVLKNISNRRELPTVSKDDVRSRKMRTRDLSTGF